MQDVYQDGVVRRHVRDLRPGDRVDLQADVFADPDGHVSPDGEGKPEYVSEYQVVDSVEIETADCICVYFQDTNPVGFPPDHLVDVDGEQIREGQ